MAGSLSGIKAGKAFILIEAIDATGKILNGVRNRMGKFGTEMSNIGRTMALRMIGALTPAAFAVKSGAAYDDIMRKVEARSEGTAAEMAILRKQTLSLASAFGVLPSTIGAGQNIFAQAGFSRGEIAGIVPSITQLARATGDSADGMQDMQFASDAVTAVLRAFHMPAAKAAEVASKIGITAVDSSFGLEGITTSLSHAASAASIYGISLDEMLSVMAAMKDIQIDDSIVGTAFRNMMGYMSQTDEQEKFNKKLQELTGNTIRFVDAMGNLEGPAKILPALLKATEGMGSAERMNLLFGLLETRAVIPAIAAGSSTNRIAAVQDSLQNWEGRLDKMQKHMDAGMGGAFRRFGANLEKLAIKFTDALAPALLTANTYLEVIMRTSDEWLGKNAGLITSVIAMAAGFLALGTALVVVGQAVISISALFGLGAFLASTVSYLLAFVAPWAAAAAGIYLAAKAIDDFSGGALNVDGHLTALTTSLGTARDKFGEFASAGNDTLTHLKAEWSQTFASISDSLKGGDLASAFQTLSAQLKVTWAELINSLMSGWEGFQQFISDTVSQLSVSFDEVGARAAALFAYHFEAKPGEDRAAVGARAYNAYKESAQATREGMLAESQNSPEAQARAEAKRKRENKLSELRADMYISQQDARARLAIRDNDDHDAELLREAESRTKSSADRKAALDAAAGGLIGRGVPTPAIPKGGNDALDIRSAEAMKSFMENNYAAYGDKAAQTAEESRDLLASIDRKIGEGVGVV